jgi:hypothetical protein
MELESEIDNDIQLIKVLGGARIWIDEAYKYGFDLKAFRRCCENAKNNLEYIIDVTKEIEKEEKDGR